MKELATLRKAAFHLQYEIGMLFETAHKLETCDDVVLYNALLESFLVHARNLIFFFYEDPFREDDIVAGHFIEGWKQMRGFRSPLLRRAGEEANKKVTHLTYRRLNDSYSWDVAAITREIRAVLVQFCQAVDDGHVNPGFKHYALSISSGGSEVPPHMPNSSGRDNLRP